MKNKNLLIIGGTGFVGKSFVDCFNDKKLVKYGITELKILARNIKNIKKNIPIFKNRNVQIIQGDISKIKKIPFADYIIHAAASTDERKYLKYPKKQTLENINNLKNFLRIIKKKKFKKSKIIFLSSGAVYGRIKNKTNSQENAELKNYNDLILKKNKISYTLSKITCENIINKELKKKNFNIKIARLFSFVGRHTPLEKHFLIGNILNSILNKKNFIVKSKSPQTTIRSFLYADDMVNLLMKILSVKKSNQNIFNIGSPEYYNLYNLEKIVTRKYKIKFVYSKNISNIESYDIYFPNMDLIKATFKNFRFLKLSKAIELTINKLIKTK